MMKQLEAYDDSIRIDGEEKSFSSLCFELIRYIFALPAETRAQLLAFLHLVEDMSQIGSELEPGENGEICLKLFSLHPTLHAERRPPADNVVEIRR